MENQKKLKETKNKCLAVIYDGIINNKPIDFSKERMPQRLRNLVNNTTKRAKKIKADNKADLALALLLFFNKIQYDYRATHIINEFTRDLDNKNKARLLKEMQKNKGKPFYLASWHKDSATDHKDYQGKLYIDIENASADDIAYAKQHNLKTLQWVTGPPVYFVTRPYCRHYFVQYSLEQVKRGVKPPTRKVGDRRLQTPAHATLEFYQDRLRQLEGLYRVYKIPRLKHQIDKTKLLIRKWQEYIHTQKGTGTN